MVVSEALLGVAIGLVIAVLGGISGVIDRRLMTDVIDETGALVVTSMGTTFLVGVTASLYVGIKIPGSPIVIAALLVAGVLKSAPLYLYFTAVRQEDITVVAPVASTSPLWVAVLAFVFLGEQLAPVEYAAIGVTIFGIILLNYEAVDVQWLGRPVVFSASFAILGSIQTVLYKYAITEADIWTAVFFVNVVSFSVAVLAMRSGAVRAELRALVTGVDPQETATVALSELVSSVKGVLKFVALGLAPASIISPVTATTPAFTFLLVVLLSGVFGLDIDDGMGRRVLVRKLVATLLVTVGIVILV